MGSISRDHDVRLSWGPLTVASPFLNRLSLPSCSLFHSYLLVFLIVCVLFRNPSFSSFISLVCVNGSPECFSTSFSWISSSPSDRVIDDTSGFLCLWCALLRRLWLVTCPHDSRSWEVEGFIWNPWFNDSWGSPPWGRRLWGLCWKGGPHCLCPFSWVTTPFLSVSAWQKVSADSAPLQRLENSNVLLCGMENSLGASSRGVSWLDCLRVPRIHVVRALEDNICSFYSRPWYCLVWFKGHHSNAK